MLPFSCGLAIHVHSSFAIIFPRGKYVIAWMLQTRSMEPSLIYMVSFPFVTLNKLVSVKTKLCRRCLTSHLNRIYNCHAQKCYCLLIIHPQISKWVTAKILLVSPASILVGE